VNGSVRHGVHGSGQTARLTLVPARRLLQK